MKSALSIAVHIGVLVCLYAGFAMDVEGARNILQVYVPACLAASLLGVLLIGIAKPNQMKESEFSPISVTFSVATGLAAGIVFAYVGWFWTSFAAILVEFFAKVFRDTRKMKLAEKES